MVNGKDNKLRFIAKYEEVLGVTKSLRQGTGNFLMHFRGKSDEEWTSTQRENIINAIAERYKNCEGRQLQIFGISSKNLDEFVTSEKDALRKICKMPNAEFLVAGAAADDDMDFEDDEEMTGDNWILVDSAPKKIEFDADKMHEKI